MVWFSRFVHGQEGVAQTEYLVLLGMLLGGVIGSVFIVSEGLRAAMFSWAQFFLSLVS